MTKYHRVVLEQGSKKTFATAIDWPGWSRSGKSGDHAIDVLVSYADRYQRAAWHMLDHAWEMEDKDLTRPD